MSQTAAPIFSWPHPFLPPLAVYFFPSLFPYSAFFMQKCPYVPPLLFHVFPLHSTPPFHFYHLLFAEHCAFAPPSPHSITKAKAFLFSSFVKNPNVWSCFWMLSLWLFHPELKPALTSCMSPSLSFTLLPSSSPSDLSSLSSARLLSSWAHSVVGVRVDWPESASWTPSSLFDPPPSSVSPFSLYPSLQLFTHSSLSCLRGK